MLFFLKFYKVVYTPLSKLHLKVGTNCTGDGTLWADYDFSRLIKGSCKQDAVTADFPTLLTCPTRPGPRIVE